MLKLQNITKKYQDIIALHDVSIEIEDGIYALLGPNGAGKSTLMNSICKNLKLTSGTILWNDQNINDLGNEYLRILGYAPQQQGLYDDMTGFRFLTYMALLKDIPKSQIHDEVKRVASLVNMEDLLMKKCKSYSGGMKQRILVAQALLGSPKLLLFDEPTAGLDPKERVSLRDVFHSLSKHHTVIIATHVVSDIETIADKVIFLKKGHVVEQGTIRELITKWDVSKLEKVYLKLYEEEQDETPNL